MHLGVLIPIFLLALLSVPLWPALAALLAVTQRDGRQLARQGLLFFSGVAAIALFWVFDSTGFVRWLLD
jgi:O-antigen/teichoic acid export membrane protein